jgi:hypothetical protein
VKFSFLNYSVIVFLFCVLLMFVISDDGTAAQRRRGRAADAEWGGGGVTRVFDRADVAWTGMVGCFIVGLWVHFR